MNKILCRICSESKEEQLVELFSLESDQSYAEKVNFCTGIEISENDGLPQMICTTCITSIQQACDIKTKCIETDIILRELFKAEQEEIGNFKLVFVTPEADCLPVYKSEPVLETQVKQQKPTKNLILHEKLRKPRKARRNKPKTEDFRCFICDKVYEKISTKIQHIKTDHVTDLFCKTCNSKKPSSLSTEKCLRDHSLGPDFMCEICAKPFRHKYYLLKHQTTFHAEASNAEIFICDLCGLQTKYKMNLYRHLKSVHLNSNKYNCPHSDTCHDVVYTTKEGLNIHLYRTHGVEAPVTCSSCKLGFSFVSELKIHRKICGGVLRASGKGAKNKNFKQYCEVIEEGFRCKVCQKVFKEKQNWSYHYSSTHRDNRTCEICNKEFTNYTNFFRHVNVQHKKIKKFHCEFPGCEKSFGQKGSLINHRNTHTGEKPFACNFCSFRSGDKSTVIKHKKKLHSQEQQEIFIKL